MRLKIFDARHYALLVAILVSGSFAAPAIAGDKVNGSFYLSEDNCTKTGGNSDCKLNFQISGDAARTLYERLKIKPVKDACTEGLRKDDGHGLRCYLTDGKNYDCDFGYNFARKSFGDSDVSC
jgi:hypothetical protein